MTARLRFLTSSRNSTISRSNVLYRRSSPSSLSIGHGDKSGPTTSLHVRPHVLGTDLTMTSISYRRLAVCIVEMGLDLVVNWLVQRGTEHRTRHAPPASLGTGLIGGPAGPKGNTSSPGQILEPMAVSCFRLQREHA